MYSFGLDIGRLVGMGRNKGSSLRLAFLLGNKVVLSLVEFRGDHRLFELVNIRNVYDFMRLERANGSVPIRFTCWISTIEVNKLRTSLIFSESLRSAGWCEAHPKISTIIRANNMPGLFFFIKFSGDFSWLFVVGPQQKECFPLENLD